MTIHIHKINVENIQSAHHYTDSDVKTAAAAANAGTCLEDGNSEKNIFSNVGSAVKAVSYFRQNDCLGLSQINLS